MTNTHSSARWPNGLSEVSVDLTEDGLAIVEIHRPPHNYFDAALVEALRDAYIQLNRDDAVRAVVLCSEGKNFCAGANLTGSGDADVVNPDEGARALYGAAVQLFSVAKPVVAAVQGAAVGGGLGLALSADFRVASARSRFRANFTLLGVHHGFGLTVTLPEVVGQQRALDMLLTGRSVAGDEAVAINLCDRLVSDETLRSEALGLARELANAAPLATQSIRSTMRATLAERVSFVIEHELAEQRRLRATGDFAEGVSAWAERRPPRFAGH